MNSLSNKEFREVYSNSFRYYTKLFRIYVYKGDKSFDKDKELMDKDKKRECSDPLVMKIGISISSKVGIAVVRNKLRRRIKAVFREYAHLNRRTKIIVVAKKEAAQASWIDIREDLTSFMDKLSITGKNV